MFLAIVGCSASQQRPDTVARSRQVLLKMTYCETLLAMLDRERYLKTPHAISTLLEARELLVKFNKSILYEINLQDEDILKSSEESMDTIRFQGRGYEDFLRRACCHELLEKTSIKERLSTEEFLTAKMLLKKLDDSIQGEINMRHEGILKNIEDAIHESIGTLIRRSGGKYVSDNHELMEASVSRYIYMDNPRVSQENRDLMSDIYDVYKDQWLKSNNKFNNKLNTTPPEKESFMESMEIRQLKWSVEQEIMKVNALTGGAIEIKVDLDVPA